jgi:hypothetical protein
MHFEKTSHQIRDDWACTHIHPQYTHKICRAHSRAQAYDCESKDYRLVSSRQGEEMAAYRSGCNTRTRSKPKRMTKQIELFCR